MTTVFDDSLSVAGGTTIVGDNNRKIGDFTEGVNGLGKGQLPHGLPQKRNKEPFNIAVDYMDESRPYFIKIGKDGVIPALHKLDSEMRNVSLDHT